MRIHFFVLSLFLVCFPRKARAFRIFKFQMYEKHKKVNCVFVCDLLLFVSAYKRLARKMCAQFSIYLLVLLCYSKGHDAIKLWITNRFRVQIPFLRSETILAIFNFYGNFVFNSAPHTGTPFPPEEQCQWIFRVWIQ